MPSKNTQIETEPEVRVQRYSAWDENLNRPTSACIVSSRSDLPMTAKQGIRRQEGIKRVKAGQLGQRWIGALRPFGVEAVNLVRRYATISST